MNTVQSFLKLKQKRLEKNLEQNHQKQKLNTKTYKSGNIFKKTLLIKLQRMKK